MKHLPNLLSLARLALAPFVFVLLWQREYGAVLILFAIAAVTDGLDGYLARKFSAGSQTGAYLDPLADKILLSGTFLTLAMSGVVGVWLAVLVLGRDILILLAALLLFSRSWRDFPPSVWGKASTIFQIVFVLAVILHLAGFGTGPLVPPLEIVTVALTIWSGIDYGWRAAARERPPANERP